MQEQSAALVPVRLDVPQRFVREALADLLSSAGHQVLEDADLVLHAPPSARAGWALTSTDGRRRDLPLSDTAPLEDLLRVLVPGPQGTAPSAAAPARGEALLTAREQEVLAALGRAGTTAAAARELGISPKTVSNHKDSIFRKLRVQSLAQAIAVAQRSGAAGG